jgi:cytochrome c-type biogenesis protein CcmH
MTVFWLIGAGLAALTLFLVLRPLWWRRAAPGPTREGANLAVYRDQLRELDADLAAGTLAQADYDQSRRELEARLLQDVSTDTKGISHSKTAVVAAGVAIPMLALVLYLVIGSPGSFTGDEHVERMVARLAAHLRENPDDVTGWKLLGRSYAALGRFDEATQALARAATHAPQDAQLLVDLADALGMARGRSLQGEPEKLVLRALEIDPQNAKGLALAGTAAFDRRDFAAAARYWERMLPLVPPDSEDARVIRENVAEARKLAGAAGGGLRGRVEIAAALKGKIKPDDTLFIVARAEKGPRVPLAILRTKAAELPLSFNLDDSMSMAPGMTLSAFPRVVVSARISRSGEATPRPGDLQGTSKPAANDAAGVRVLIDSEVR